MHPSKLAETERNQLLCLSMFSRHNPMMFKVGLLLSSPSHIYGPFPELQPRIYTEKTNTMTVKTRVSLSELNKLHGLQRVVSYAGCCSPG